MTLDKDTKDTLLQIQQELSNKGRDYSLQELASIVESQFIASTLAFKKGIEVRLPRFGTFQRLYRMEYGNSVKELNEIKDTISEEEYKARLSVIKMNNKAFKQEQKKNRKIISFEEFKNTPDKVGVVSKYDKSL